MVKWSLWNFAHDTAVVLAWHLHNVLTIWYPTMELNKIKFPSNLYYDGKAFVKMEPWLILTCLQRDYLLCNPDENDSARTCRCHVATEFIVRIKPSWIIFYRFTLFQRQAPFLSNVTNAQSIMILLLLLDILLNVEAVQIVDITWLNSIPIPSLWSTYWGVHSRILQASSSLSSPSPSF